MKKLKLFFMFFMVFNMFFLLSFNTYALDEYSESEKLGEDTIKSLIDATDDETSDLLKSLGLDENSIEAILEISPHKVIELIFDIFRGKFFNIAKAAFILLALLIIVSLIDVFFDESSEMTAYFSALYSIFFSLIIIAPLVSCITNVLSAISLTRNFSLVLIPLFAGIITASGSPALALSYHSLSFFASQGISVFASKYLTAFMGINLSLCISSAINPLFDIEGVIGTVKKIFTKTLSLIGTLFAGLLSIKGLLAASADSLAFKGTKFMLGGFVPVIGSVLGDALSSIIGSLSLLNSFVGAFGIIIIALISLPVIIEVLIWWFVLNISSFAASMLGKEEISKLFEGLSDVVIMLNVLLIFIVFLFIVSIGLTLALKK